MILVKTIIKTVVRCFIRKLRSMANMRMIDSSSEEVFDEASAWSFDTRSTKEDTITKK